MPRVKSAFQHVSDFERSQTVVYQNCRLSHRGITVRVDPDPRTVYRTRNLWVQEGHTMRRARSQFSISLRAEERNILTAWPYFIVQPRHKLRDFKCHQENFCDTFIISSETIILATLDATSQTRETSMII